MYAKFCGAEQSFIRFQKGQWGHFHLKDILRTSLVYLIFRFIFYQWMEGFVHKESRWNIHWKKKTNQICNFNYRLALAIESFPPTENKLSYLVYGDKWWTTHFLAVGRWGWKSVECATTKKIVMTHMSFTWK